MVRANTQPRRRPTQHQPPQVVLSDQHIHDAVAECVQHAADENGTAADFVYRHVQLLITQGWKSEDAELVGSRAIGVLNAMRRPPAPHYWG